MVSGGRTKCVDDAGASYTLEEGSTVPDAVGPIYQHAQNCLEKCKEIEMAITGLSSDGSYFPITVRRCVPYTDVQYWL